MLCHVDIGVDVVVAISVLIGFIEVVAVGVIGVDDVFDVGVHIVIVDIVDGIIFVGCSAVLVGVPIKIKNMS